MHSPASEERDLALPRWRFGLVYWLRIVRTDEEMSYGGFARADGLDRECLRRGDGCGGRFDKTQSNARQRAGLSVAAQVLPARLRTGCCDPSLAGARWRQVLRRSQWKWRPHRGG